MKKEKVIIVGAGLSGSLLAILLAQRNYEVVVYERRPDMRKVPIPAGRSINLAYSNRGIKALQYAGLADKLKNELIPMKGRLIHPIQGETYLLPYSGRKENYINAISRGNLNKFLLNEAEAHGVKIYFETPCIDVILEEAKVVLKQKDGSLTTDQGKVVIGADGAFSAVRNAFMKVAPKLRFSFSQSYLDHGYKELCIPPDEQGNFRIEPNALHIWPRGEFMMIALPNTDGSFTVTLFLSFEGDPSFATLRDEKSILSFFESQFPDALPLMPTLLEDFRRNPASSLATIRCYPWQAYGKVLLIGDAAHAVVPFYGQGMNASFEDCRILCELLEQYQGDWEKTLETFQKERKPDADAIADLAEENFYEMRDHVNNPYFIQKRNLELQLEAKFPEYYSKYSLVTFCEDVPYRVAKRLGNAQDAFLLDLVKKHSVESLSLQSVFDDLMRLRQQLRVTL